MGLDEIAKEALAKHHFSLAKKTSQLNAYQLEEIINGTEKVNSIYSIHKPFIYCNILQKRMIMQHLKNILKL